MGFTMGAASSGSVATASIGARQMGSSTPASIALASGFGMLVMARPSAGHSPHSSSSAAHTRKAPTASENLMPSLAVASSTAAPGVDQAKASGMRSHTAATMLVIATARHTANSPDDASLGDAPTAASPAITSANDDAKPEMAATNPADIGWKMVPLLVDEPQYRGVESAIRPTSPRGRPCAAR